MSCWSRLNLNILKNSLIPPCPGHMATRTGAATLSGAGAFLSPGRSPGEGRARGISVTGDALPGRAVLVLGLVGGDRQSRHVDGKAIRCIIQLSEGRLDELHQESDQELSEKIKTAVHFV